MNSLDPRVNRLPPEHAVENDIDAAVEQLGTFEVFVQPREGKPFQHEGAVHAPNAELAFILAKESFTRRFTCVALWVAETIKVAVSETTEGHTHAYETIAENIFPEDNSVTEAYEIFHLPKRGKQHVHFKTVEARHPNEAMRLAKEFLAPSSVFFNVWSVRAADIRKTSHEEMDLWTTLPEKKFRDASAYKGGDKLKDFLAKKSDV